MKIRRPGDGSPPGRGGRPSPLQFAIEKKEAQYIHLECGHLTTWETNLAYAAWQTRRSRGLYFCETCCKWKKLHPKPKRENTAQQPLF